MKPMVNRPLKKIEKGQRKYFQLCSKEIAIDLLDKRRTFTERAET